MKTKDEIKKRKKWITKAIGDADNDTTYQQIKLYVQLDILEWLGDKNA